MPLPALSHPARAAAWTVVGSAVLMILVLDRYSETETSITHPPVVSPPWAEVPLWRIEKDLEIRGDETITAEIGPVISGVVAPNGSLAVSQFEQRHVKRFDPVGRPLPVLGRRGDGPGEFRTIGRIGLIADTLWVTDERHLRITFFRPDGVLLRTEDAPSVTARTSVISVLASRNVLSASIEREIANGDSATFAVFRVHDRAGRNVRELFRAPTRPLSHRIDLGNGGGTTLRLPFRDWPLVSASPNGKYFAIVEVPIPRDSTAFFTVHRFGADGDRLFPPARGSIPAFGVKESLVDSFAAQQVRAATGGRVDAKLTAALKAAMFVGPYLPPFGKLLVGNDGAIWLQRSDTASYWFVLDRESRIVGRLALPQRNVMFAVGENHVWTMEFDDFDVPILVRFKVALPR